MNRSWIKNILFALVVGATATVGVEGRAQDWSVQSGDERQQEIIARYKTMLEENPVEGMALQRLLGYVGRGAGLDRLIDEYRQRLERRPQASNLHIIVGHLLMAKGAYEEALLAYEQAIELKAGEAHGWLGRGKARLMLGDRRLAMEDFEEALSRERDRERKREILQQLGELSFSQRDFERGKEFYQRLLAEQPRDAFLRMSYVGLLVQYRQFEEALEQYDALINLAGRDTRQRATYLREKADVLEMMDRFDEAIQTYEQALRLVQGDSWVAREVRAQLVNIYRRAGDLDGFVKTYGSQWSRGSVDQQILIADIYAEMGRLEEALTIYRRAAGRDGQAVEPRQKIIRVLERLGREKEIPAAYQALIRAAPGRQQFRFELADYHIRQGDRGAAEKALDDAAQRFRNDPYVLLEVAAYYSRWRFGEKARRTYEEVLRREPREDGVIIEVGDFYFDSGERERAMEVWSGLPKSRLGEQAGRERLAEIYVERGIMNQGLALYAQLLEERPDDERLLRSAAHALERARRYEEALKRWEHLLNISTDRQRRQEARARIVDIHQRLNSLLAEMRRWRTTFDEAEGEESVNAGFFLVEAFLRLRDLGDAQALLMELREHPALSEEDQVTALLLLEQAYMRGQQHLKAVEVLEELAQLRPELERDLLNRMAEHALAAEASEQAVNYGMRALEANADDAQAQARLGDIYAGTGDLESAVRHYRTATEIDHRAYESQLKLGAALQGLGRHSEAEEVLTAVVTNADEDQLVLDAGHTLLKMAKARGRLMALEAQWSPLVMRMPLRQVHARLMLELYHLVAGPLLIERSHGAEEERERAQNELKALGERASALIIDQLQGDNRSQQAQALRLAAELEVELAGPLVARLVRGEDERMHRMAIATAARLGQEGFINPLEQILGDGSAQERHMAIWALGHIDEARASQLLAELAAPSMEGLAAQLAWLGLDSAPNRTLETLLKGRFEGMSPGRAELGQLLSLAAELISSGGGQGLRGELAGLLQQGESGFEREVARVYAGFGDAESAAALWKLAMSSDELEAKRGEEGLRQFFSEQSPSPRDVVEESRFFHWSRSEFDGQGLYEWARRQQHGPSQGGLLKDDWPAALLQGLELALQSDGAKLVSVELLERIQRDLRQERALPFWSQEGADLFGVVAEKEMGGQEVDEATELVIQLLSRSGAVTLEEVPDENALSIILEGLGQSEGAANEVAPRYIQQGLESDSALLRRKALIASTRLGPSIVDDLFIQNLLEALTDGDAATQIAAVRAAGALKIEAAYEQLLALEPEAMPALRRALRESMRQLQGSGAEP